MNRGEGRQSTDDSHQSTDLASDRAAAVALTSVSRETLDRLDRFVALLIAWQRRLNLIGKALCQGFR